MSFITPTPRLGKIALSRDLKADLHAAYKLAEQDLPMLGYGLRDAGRAGHLDNLVTHATAIREMADKLAALAGKVLEQAETERIAYIDRNPEIMPHHALRQYVVGEKSALLHAHIREGR